MYYIEMQEIISNAFISSLEHGGPRKFSFKSLMDYASAAVEEMVKEGT